ncbi:PREDICTED: breast carcinoma-amplified sequence 4 [Nipponia nippon]|uniref:breast carcinoma-amplified sequence 4 n=1 Tax=Nipponia nippon TaxID=128390 RepID=UPI0005109C83|nr:PREDICTED: breast carcinoma-amplified sequence 4 [Nipponia nippon]
MAQLLQWTPVQEIRSDTSQILDETIPLIKDKVMEMNHIYAKVDKLEAFVKMVAHHVSLLEEQVLEAEKSHGTFLNTVCKLFQCATISSFKNAIPSTRYHLRGIIWLHGPLNDVVQLLVNNFYTVVLTVNSGSE